MNVLPVINAGAAFVARETRGAFHDMMPAVIPSGSFHVTLRKPSSVENESPDFFSAHLP